MKKKTNSLFIFSGGAFSFRKGQDIVVKAFVQFLKLEPNAVLITAWYNVLAENRPKLQKELYKKFQLKSTAPLDLSKWLIRQGIRTVWYFVNAK